jgi:hypothetical protein
MFDRLIAQNSSCENKKIMNGTRTMTTTILILTREELRDHQLMARYYTSIIISELSQ